MNNLYRIKNEAVLKGAVHFNSNICIQDIATRIGNVIKDPVNGKIIDRLKNDLRSRSCPKYISYGQPKSETPFHTDYPNLFTPPKFILLQCVCEGSLPISTQYVHVARGNPLFNNALICEPWLIKKCTGRWQRCKVMVTSFRNAPLIRFATNIMRPMFPKSSVLTKLATQAADYFPAHHFQLKAGDYLLINNHAGLHRRTLSVGSEMGNQCREESDRVIDRVLIG